MMFSRTNNEAPASQLPAVIPPIPLTPSPVNPSTVRAVSLLDFHELLELKQHVDQELKHRGEKELSQLRDKLQAIAALQGTSVEDLMSPPKPERKPRKKREARQGPPEEPSIDLAVAE